MVNDVERSLSSMIIGTRKAFERRDASRQEVAFDETILNFQGSVEGHAGSAIGTTTITVEFEAPFYNAPGLKDSELEFPQFSVGVHLESGSGVQVTAHVSSWTIDEEQDAIKGAVVEVAAVAPGTSGLVQFTANLHLSFHGLGAPLEDESEMA